MLNKGNKKNITLMQKTTAQTAAEQQFANTCARDQLQVHLLQLLHMKFSAISSAFLDRPTHLK
jgi:hypothetical protein